MKNLIGAILAFIFFSILGLWIYPLGEGERFFTASTFVITQLLIAIYIKVWDIHDMLKANLK